ncbi:hypothetical protein HIM_11929 [Hirsutella minnesotensis 3608]|uniref:Uncharacterized protein n=1 Tax=Hirsutella minnesotensis 3608 TaxID=1043627 RepID=A0A0F7ZQY5_9HYPO|nr:hypothetical protein HIM_11929 [Hirsutella minnesotensis 3608]
MALADARPLWGIIAPPFAERQNLSTVRKESLYLPGMATSAMSKPVSTVQNLPGVEFYTGALACAYNIGPNTLAFLDGTISDYSGRSNIAMYAKWQEFSHTEKTTSKILNLIWTDLAASAVMGTKGVLGPGKDGTTLESVRIPVRPIVRQIKCGYLFAIPSFVGAVLWFLISIATLISGVMGGSDFATMRRQLRRTSTGRILTAILYPQEPNLKTKTKDWVHAVGTKYIDLSGTSPAIRNVDDGRQAGPVGGGREDLYASGRESYDKARERPIRDADQHGQPSVDVREPGPVGRGGEATGAGDGESQDEARGRPSRHGDQHGQPSVDVSEPGPVGRGREAVMQVIETSETTLGASHPDTDQQDAVIGDRKEHKHD